MRFEFDLPQNCMCTNHHCQPPVETHKSKYENEAEPRIGRIEGCADYMQIPPTHSLPRLSLPSPCAKTDFSLGYKIILDSFAVFMY